MASRIANESNLRQFLSDDGRDHAILEGFGVRLEIIRQSFNVYNVEFNKTKVVGCSASTVREICQRTGLINLETRKAPRGKVVRRGTHTHRTTQQHSFQRRS